MDGAPCPEFLVPRLRLFVSADIVGSTALKQSGSPSDTTSVKEHSAWFSVIQGFYIEARGAFLAEWSAAQDQWPHASDCFGEPPKLWKTIGDEVLFSKVITDHRQLAVTLQCWIAAAEQLRAFVKSRSARLDVKCAAWIAGFPIRNKEVVLSQTDALDGEVNDYYKASGNLLNKHYKDGSISDLSIDYIGPSIDIGFRVAQHATPRKFVLGVGIPYVLSFCSPTQDGLIGDFPIFYDGAKSLKGVLGGVNYPIFWIDMSQPDSTWRLEDVLTGVLPPARDAIRRFCDAFYEENSTHTHRPFITSDTEQLVTEKPEWWDTLHQRLIKNFVTQDTSEMNESEASNLGVDNPVDPEDLMKKIDELIATIEMQTRELKKD